MSTVTLRIQVDKTGANENIDSVKRGLNDMGQEGAESGARAAGGVNSLKGAMDQCRQAVGLFLGVYAGIQTLASVARYADEYQSLSDRLRLATDSTAAFTAAQSGVFTIAQSTGTALSAVGGLYVSLANSTGELNLKQSELLTITEAITQSFVISGASAQQTDASVRQLSQAFASGVLRGDEFNSMMEGAPALASALASSLGVSVGQLRAMAAQGQLTSDVLANGLLRVAPELAAQFNQMGTTIGQAFTRLTNSLTRFIGEASESTGAARGLAFVITGLADNLPAFILGLSSVATGYLTMRAAALAANPQIGLTIGILSGLTAAIGFLVTAYTAFKLGEYLADEYEIVRQAGAYLVQSMNAVWETLKNAVLVVATAMRVAFLTAIDAVQEKVADLLEGFVELGQFEIFGQSVDFTYGQAAAFDTLILSLRGATDGAGDTDAAMAALREKLDASAESSLALKRGLDESIEAHFEAKTAADSLSLAHDGNSAATGRVTAAAAASKEQLAAMKAAADAAATASDQLRDMQEGLTAEVAGPAVAAYIDYAQKLRDVDALEVALTADQGLSREEAANLYSARMLLADALVRNITEINRAIPAEQAYLNELREEVRIAGLVGSERATAVIRANAETTARGLLKNATEAQVDALTDEIAALEGQKAAAEKAGEAADAWSDYWKDASGAVIDAFADLFSGGIDSLEDFGDRMLQISKQIVGDIIKEFARTGQIRLPTGMYGAGGTGASVGGWASAIGMAYGGVQNAQQGGSPVATIGSFALAGAQIGGPWGAAIGAVVGALVSVFTGNVEPLLRVRSDEFSGPRRSEGRAVSQLGNIFVRTEDTPEGAGTSPEIAQSIADFDNLIAGFLNPEQLAVVRTRLAAVNDTFRNGAFTLENAVSSRFNAILSVLSTDVQEFVGVAGTLEQRITRLVDALDISALADLPGAFTSDFEEMANLLEGFRLGQESLIDTYTRLAEGVAMVDGTLLLLGGTFDGTRLQAATFAGDLINLAGGMDQFAARLQGALEALFSDDERAQFVAQQTQAALNAALTGLNITGTGLEDVRQQLRTQLRAAMEAGNVELTNQILTAANALGAFGGALEALGEDAVAAASNTRFGGTSLSAGGTLASPAGTSTGPDGTTNAPETQIAATQAVGTTLDRHTTILQEIASNTRREPVADSLAKNAAQAQTDQAATLLEIKAMIAEAVRAQIQEQAKALAGSNGRGGVTA